jgi:uncharacterized protein
MRFEALVQKVGARDSRKAALWLFGRAEELGRAAKLSPNQALERAYARIRRRLDRFLSMRGPRSGSGEPGVSQTGPGDSFHPEPAPRFVCDAGLGGLAKWLRAAGYDAFWRYHIEDPELIALAQREKAVLLTTDSLMMERRILRDGTIPSIWVSPGLTKLEQLESVLTELGLTLRTPRCMDCGGELAPVAKEQVAARIPPKTFRWRDEYFLCRRCDKLFWYGTHWDRIRERLKAFG